MECDKIGYKTQVEAHNHIIGINKRKKISCRTYKCKDCGLYHVHTIKDGNKNKKNKRADNRNNNSVNQKSVNPIPKRSVILSVKETTYKPFEHFKFKN